MNSIFVTPAILSNNPDHIAIKVIRDERTESITLTQNIVAHKFLPVFSNAIVYLVPVGSSIYYTKCIGKKLEKTG
ncbi:hypothetical protein, partial [Mycoplasmopsis bovis]|uniref:hypothetical protein n=1 Tax=Mycoplasmopsis bovis TaxID=28903 RepID=UPI003D29EDFA